MANAQKHAPGSSMGVYEIAAGMAGANYLNVSSVDSCASFDQTMAEGMAMWEKVSQQDMAALQGVMQTGVESVITNRFRLSPTMCHVDEATKAKDPAFWNRR